MRGCLSRRRAHRDAAERRENFQAPQAGGSRLACLGPDWSYDVFDRSQVYTAQLFDILKDLDCVIMVIARS